MIKMELSSYFLLRKGKFFISFLFCLLAIHRHIIIGFVHVKCGALLRFHAYLQIKPFVFPLKGISVYHSSRYTNNYAYQPLNVIRKMCVHTTVF